MLHIDAFDGVRKAKRIGDASVKFAAWFIGTCGTSEGGVATSTNHAASHAPLGISIHGDVRFDSAPLSATERHSGWLGLLYVRLGLKAKVYKV